MWGNSSCYYVVDMEGKTEMVEKVADNHGVEANPVIQKPFGDMSHAKNLDTKNNLNEIWEGIKALLKRNKEQRQQGDK